MVTQVKKMQSEDAKIDSLNKQLRSAKDTDDLARQRVMEIELNQMQAADTRAEGEVLRSQKQKEQTGRRYAQAKEDSWNAVGTGSGHTMLLLPGAETHY